MSVYTHSPKSILKAATVFCFAVFIATVFAAPALAQSEQPVDEEYTRLIKEATTKPEF